MLEAFARLLRLKAKDSRAWTNAVIRRGGGARGETPPFSQEAGVQNFRSWVYAAASINANAVASVPLRLYVKAGAGQRIKTRQVSRERKAYVLGDGRQQPSQSVMRKAAEIGSEFEEVTETHPVLQLLAQSNPYINGFDACVLRVIWQELCGNAYLHVVTDPKLGVPSQLYPMLPQWTRIIPHEEQFVEGYLYGRNSSQEVIFSPEEVIHFRRPNPKDLWYGMGKLEGAWGAAVANAALHEMDLATFENHARPDYLLSVKGQASEEEMDSLEERIRTKFKGPSKGGHFLVSSGEIDLKPLSFPPKDIMGRADIVEEIAACFGVPVSMLKANDPNLASAKQGFQSWREMTVLPLCRMDEEVLNQRLLPLFQIDGEEAVLAYDNPVPADEQLELTRRQVAVSGGWMTPNEARKEQGLEPLEDPHAEMLHVGGMPLGGPQGGPMGSPMGAPMGSPLGAPLGSPPEGSESPSEGLPPSPPTPEASEAPDAAPAPLEAGGEPVASLALNGAQISSLVALAQSALSGEVPIASARAIATAAFPSIPPETIGEIFDPLVGAPKPPSEAEAPEAEAPQEKAEDCVSRKIRVLRDEGYPQDQAVAMAISFCEEEKRTKAVGQIDTKPPEAVAANARRALEVREEKPESERGMTSVGLARARDLSNRTDLSEETIRRMVAYFERHQSDKEGETWDEQGKGWQAWQGWGGDEGWAWAKRKVEEFDRAREAKKACKNCGTGAGGFQPGNTCGEEEGGDDADKEDSPSSDTSGADEGDEDFDEDGLPKLDDEDEPRSGAEEEWELMLEEAEELGVDEMETRSQDPRLHDQAMEGDAAAIAKLLAASRWGGDLESFKEQVGAVFEEEREVEEPLDISAAFDFGEDTDEWLRTKSDDPVEGAEPQLIEQTVLWAMKADPVGTAPSRVYHDDLMDDDATIESFLPATQAYAGNMHYRWMNDSMRSGAAPMDGLLEYADNAFRPDFLVDGEVDPLKTATAALSDIVAQHKNGIERIGDRDDARFQMSRYTVLGKELQLDQAVRELQDKAKEARAAMADDQEWATSRLEALAKDAESIFNAEGRRLIDQLKTTASRNIQKNGRAVQFVRGINVDNADVAEWRSRLQGGNIIDFKGFTSATLDTETAVSFAANTVGDRKTAPEAIMVQFTARRGLVTNPAEEEVILPPGKFRVNRRRDVRCQGTLVSFIEVEQLEAE